MMGILFDDVLVGVDSSTLLELKMGDESLGLCN